MFHQKVKQLVLDATLLARTAAVVRDRSAIFDRFDVQASSLKCRDCTFTTTAWAFDSDVNFFDTELHRLVGSLGGRTLTGKRGTFTRPLEAASTCTGPAKGFAFGVGDGDGCVVESSLNMGHAVSRVTTDSLLFCSFLPLNFLWSVNRRVMSLSGNG